MMSKNIEPQITRIVFTPATLQGIVGPTQGLRPDIQSMYPSIQITHDDAMLDFPLSASFFPDIKVTALVKKIRKPFFVSQTMDDMPLRTASTSITIKLEPCVRNRMHTGMHLFQAWNDIVRKLMGIACKKTMIVIAI